MNYDLTEDQAVLQTSIEQLVARHKTIPPGTAQYVLAGEALERDLGDGGYFDIAREEGMGALEAVLLIEAAMQSPFTVEVGASALVAPKILPGRTLPRPIVLAQAPADGAIRFLGSKGTALVDTGKDVRIVDLAKCEVDPVEAPFAYPLGVFRKPDFSSAEVVKGATPEHLRHWWRVALAAEIAGLAQATLDVTTEYVKQRKQFGKPIGALQAIHHRLAECATLVASSRMLVRYAAWSGRPEDAALAASYAQEAAARVHYDAHQFHGAMGITVECNLHYWTYRLKFIQGELGGYTASAQDVAAMLWKD
jgi:alkylation response protein AidB-like acyl-CoA dehydrogenase